MLGKDRLKLQSHISNHNLHSSAHTRGISNSSFKHTLCANETWDAAAAAQNSSGVLPVSQAGAQVWGRQSVLPSAGGDHRWHSPLPLPWLRSVLRWQCPSWRSGSPLCRRTCGRTAGCQSSPPGCGCCGRTGAKGRSKLEKSFILQLLAHLTGTADSRTFASLSKYPT